MSARRPTASPGLVAALCLAAALVPAAARAQAPETRTLDAGNGATVTYTLRTFPPGAHLAQAGARLEPTSALGTAKLLNLYLSTGDLEEAAVLSNAPRRRFEELTNFKNAYGEDEFKRVFAEYFDAKNRLVAEIAIDNRSLLVWRLNTTNRAGQPAIHYAGQYFVEVDGRYLIDDVPNDTRTRLRWVLEAYRAGKIAD